MKRRRLPFDGVRAMRHVEFLEKHSGQFDCVVELGSGQGFAGIELRPEDIDSSDRVSENAAAWSARLDYNKNLVALLRGLADEDRIRIDLEQRYVSGDNPFNPTSVIRWTKT